MPAPDDPISDGPLSTRLRTLYSEYLTQQDSVGGYQSVHLEPGGISTPSPQPARQGSAFTYEAPAYQSPTPPQPTPPPRTWDQIWDEMIVAGAIPSSLG